MSSGKVMKLMIILDNGLMWLTSDQNKFTLCGRCFVLNIINVNFNNKQYIIMWQTMVPLCHTHWNSLRLFVPDSFIPFGFWWFLIVFDINLNKLLLKIIYEQPKNDSRCQCPSGPKCVCVWVYTKVGHPIVWQQSLERNLDL